MSSQDKRTVILIILVMIIYIVGINKMCKAKNSELENRVNRLEFMLEYTEFAEEDSKNQ